MIIEALFVALVSFGKNTIGIITRPYETCRAIIDHGRLWELVYIGFLMTMYFALASLVKTASFRPFLLTRQFFLLSGVAAMTYCVVVGLLWEVGKIVGGKGKLSSLMLGWAYTLVPTVLWFLVTSLLYVLLPPPRTSSPAGVAFSLSFLVFSTTLFLWKIILGYLTLRFSLHLDLSRILMVVTICTPLVAIYSMWMYRLGIFKVPFL